MALFLLFVCLIEVRRWQEVEAGKIRAEEATKYRRELDTMGEQLRAEYNDKLQK